MRAEHHRSIELLFGVIVITLALFMTPALITASYLGQQQISPGPEKFRRVRSARTFKHAPGAYEFVYEEGRGPSPFDRIGLHRTTRGPRPSAHPQIVMLYLPGMNMNGEIAVDDSRYSLRLYLAQHGVDVWSFDYRTHFVPPSAQQSDLIELKDWTKELFESDIAEAVRFIRASTGRRKIFVVGFSRGVEFASLYAAMHPKDVQALVLIDGVINYGRPGAPARGVYADDLASSSMKWEERDALLKTVINDPDGPAPDTQYPSAADDLKHVVYDPSLMSRPGALSNPFGGFADPEVLAKVLIRFDRYWPAIQDYEISFTQPMVEALWNSRIPVLAFCSTNVAHSWPSRVTVSAQSTGSEDVTVKHLDHWGHLDVMHGTHAREAVFAPTLEWLTQHRR